MIKTLDDLPVFFRFLVKNLKILIFMFLCITYLLVFRYMRYQRKDSRDTVIEKTDYEILKLVDIVEYVPPPPKPKPVPPKPKVEEKIIQVEEQPAAAENIVEVEEKVEEIINESEETEESEETSHNVGATHPVEEIEYLPQHKITKVPQLPVKEIMSKILYPPMARRQGIEGVVYLELYIDADGTIRKIEILKDPGHGFAEAAIAALDGIICVPAQANGVNVPVRFRYPVRFQLK